MSQLIIFEDFSAWFEKQKNQAKNWMISESFKKKPGSVCLLPDKDGKIEKVLLAIQDKDDFWSFGVLPDRLPEGVYGIFEEGFSKEQLQRCAIAFGLGKYKFTKYKKDYALSQAMLFLPQSLDSSYVKNVVDSISFTRDLINTPAEDMTPASLLKEATSLSIEFNCKIHHTAGYDLLKKGFNAIHTVGRASCNEPLLIDLHWKQNKKMESPKIALVGKGVCFDAGGLNLKPSDYLKGMERDMAGAAHVLGLARMIMSCNLPVDLHVYIPAVENLISGNSYKPADIIKTYKGLTVEVRNTDAEGRLILADALTLASEEKPDLIIDFGTLTGAARVALGPEIPALFTDCDDFAEGMLHFVESENDPICRMPLYKPYRKLLNTKIADIANVSNIRVGGAVTAALFLREFVDKSIPWVHFDIPGDNITTLPGRPKGGEVHVLRALFNYLVKKYGK